MTTQQHANLTAILRKATALINRDKAAAVQRGDIAQSIAIANRQAQVESYFRAQGVEIEEPDL